MKTLFAIFVLVIGLAQTAEAAKRAPFPDETQLQPLPVSAHPNVSGNVNSTNDIAPETLEENSFEAMQAGSANEENQDAAADNPASQKSSGFSLVTVLAAVGICLLVGAGVFVARKRFSIGE